MIKKQFFIYFLLLCSLLWSNCTKKKTPEVYPEIDIAGIKPEMIRGRIFEKSKSIQSLRGSASFKIKIDDQEDSFDAFILYKHPKQLRVDIYGFWGKLLLISRMENDSLQLYIPSENWIINSHVSSTDLKQWIGFDIDFENLLYAIDYFQQPLETELHDSLVLGVDKHKYKLTVKEREKRFSFWIDNKQFLIREAELVKNNDFTMVNYYYNDYQLQNGKYYADKIRIEYPLLSHNLSIDFDSIELNPKLTEDVFKFNYPDNVDYFYLKN